MDALVEAALRKWPNVPACYGWLALDARGDWYMRDDRVQAAGPFPAVKGSRIQHDKLLAFIGRNYGTDDAADGAWFFQNGPQRVYVELEAAPWIWRVDGTPGAPRVHSHTGEPATPTGAWLDEHGRLFLQTDLGLGLVHSQDMLPASELLEAGCWPLDDASHADLVHRAGLCLSPASRTLAAATAAAGASGR